MFEKFTDRALEVIAKATAKAKDFRHPEVTPLHLVWAVFEPSTQGIASNVIDGLQARDRFVYLEAEVTALTAILNDCDLPSEPPLSPDSLTVMKDATVFALAQAKFGLWGVGTHHLGYALLADTLLSKSVGITQEQWLDAMNDPTHLIPLGFHFAS